MAQYDATVRQTPHVFSDSPGMSEWMRLNKLSANPQKTEHMFVGYPYRTNKITDQGRLKLNGSGIKRVKKTKSLGVIIDQGLNCEDQFKAIKGKVRGGLAPLKHLKKRCFAISIKQCLSCARKESYKIR